MKKKQYWKPKIKAITVKANFLFIDYRINDSFNDFDLLDDVLASKHCGGCQCTGGSCGPPPS